MMSLCYLFIFLSGLFACSKGEPVVKTPAEETFIFDTIPASTPVVPLIMETSGMADSKAYPGNLWLHEDSGTPTQLMLLGHDGKVKRKVFLKGTINRDWEEMALSGTDIFVADIGDNRQIYPTYTVYQFAEPEAGIDTVKEIRNIEFKYPDGSHDAEAFLVDPQTKDIFIITKRDTTSRIYKLTAPYSFTSLNTASYIGNLPYNGVVGGALSADGTELMLKTYTKIYYYTRLNKETIPEALQQEGRLLPYQLEPQGEAIAFTNANTGFYTLSEKAFSNRVDLNFYKRK